MRTRPGFLARHFIKGEFSILKGDSKFSKTAPWAVVTALCLLVLIMVALGYWGRNRGVCISDEAYCIMQAMDPHRYAVSLTSWHFIANKLPRLSSHAISNARLWLIVLSIFSAFAMSFGFIIFEKRHLWSGKGQFPILVVAMVCIANLLPLSCYPLSLTYNGLLNSLLCTAAGAFISMCALLKNKQNNVSILLLSCLVGFFAGFALFVKATSFIAFSLICAVLLFFIADLRIAIRLVIGQFLGMLSAFICYFTFMQDLNSWRVSLGGALTALQQYSSPIAYVFSGSTTITVNVLTQIASFIPLAVLAFYLHKRSLTVLNTSLLVSLFVLESAYFQLFSAGTTSVAIYYGLGIVVLGLVLSVFFHNDFTALGASEPVATNAFHSQFQTNRTFIIVAIFLFLFPFACSIGTGNSIIAQTTIHLSGWFLFIYCAIDCLCVRAQSLLPKLTVCSLFGAICAIHFFQGYLLTPYGLALPLKDQNIPTTVPGLRGQKICYGGQTFLEQSYKILKSGNFQKGDIILAFYNLPGIVMAAEGVSAGAPGFFTEPCMEPLITKGIEQIQPRERIFIIESWQISPQIIQALKAKGLGFPEDFQFLGSLTNPYGDPYSGRQDLNKRYLNCKVNFYAARKQVTN